MTTPIETLAIERADKIAQATKMPPLEAKINFMAEQEPDSTFAENLLYEFQDTPEETPLTRFDIETWTKRNGYHAFDNSDQILDILEIVQLMRDGNGEYDAQPEEEMEEPYIVRQAFSTHIFQEVNATSEADAMKKAKEPDLLHEGSLKEILENMERDDIYDEAFKLFSELTT